MIISLGQKILFIVSSIMLFVTIEVLYSAGSNPDQDANAKEFSSEVTIHPNSVDSKDNLVNQNNKHLSETLQIPRLFRSHFEMSEEEWGVFVERELLNYPMSIKLLNVNNVLLRLTSNPIIILPSELWMVQEEEVHHKRMNGNDYRYLCVLPSLVTNKERQGKIRMLLYLQSDHTSALGTGAVHANQRFVNSSRPNTAHGVQPISIRNASFVRNYDGEGAQLLFFVVGNIVAQLDVLSENAPPLHISNSLLSQMASRLSHLFDRPPVVATNADPAGMDVRLGRIEEGWLVAATTPDAGPYHGWWLRLDTTDGEIEVKASGEAVIRDVPETGAKITVYAISPDGKIWHSASREIRAE